MEDERIVSLYWDRNEQAISETAAKYGAYCHTVAMNILGDRGDAEECVNDTWLQAWKAMPPHRPGRLAVFLGKITRNLAFDRYKALHRDKRGSGQMNLVLEELEECVSGQSDPESQLAGKELAEEIDRFLKTLPKEKRYLVILRYWNAESIPALAKRFAMSENNVSVTLNRIRKKLKAHLDRAGYEV